MNVVKTIRFLKKQNEIISIHFISCRDLPLPSQYSERLRLLMFSLYKSRFITQKTCSWSCGRWSPLQRSRPRISQSPNYLLHSISHPHYLPAAVTYELHSTYSHSFPYNTKCASQLTSSGQTQQQHSHSLIKMPLSQILSPSTRPPSSTPIYNKAKAARCLCFVLCLKLFVLISDIQ